MKNIRKSLNKYLQIILYYEPILHIHTTVHIKIIFLYNNTKRKAENLGIDKESYLLYMKNEKNEKGIRI